MSARYTQSKAETAAHLEILKGMLKKPENKLCADCKRNDPRWASTNLGCFMCIRCSGIHRGMGVHITRIKSVDLDTWTPAQIELIQRWGNARANAYWEAHLKPGHVPPEHKMESFIRSKYETGRWKMEGPVPEPESLDSGASYSADVGAKVEQSVQPTTTRTASSSQSQPTTRKAPNAFDLLGGAPSSSSSSVKSAPTVARTPAAAAPSPTPAAPSPSPPVQKPAPSNGLGDLDFFASGPSSSQTQQQQPPKKDAKADILSLFSAAPPPRPVQVQPQQQQGQAGLVGGFGGMSLGGSSGAGGDLWSGGGAGAGGGGWGAFESSPAPVQTNNGGFGAFSSSQPSVPQQQGWGAPPPAQQWGVAAAAPAPAPPQANDPFGEFGSGSFGGFSSGAGSGGAKKATGGASEFSDIWA